MSENASVTSMIIGDMRAQARLALRWRVFGTQRLVDIYLIMVEYYQ